MQGNPIAEWQRLAEHYRGLGDEELKELAADFGDLTETAQQALRSELSSRGLDAPQATETAPRWPVGPASSRWGSSVDPDAGQTEAATSDVDGEDDRPKEFTWKTVLCECDGPEQALQIRAVLGQAGIESWVEQRGSRYALDMSNPRVLVAADQLDLAREIVSRPIPQEIVDHFAEEAPAFEAPKCPECGADDPVLESADPVNAWLCEACGRQWTESPDGVLGEPETDDR
jgi:hypothetical protein